MPTETRVLWGPVTKQVADAIGVPTAVASVLLRPSSATAEAAARMEALVPANILPTAGDTLKSLVARLAQSEYLHPKSVLSRGNGTGQRKYIDLNSTRYAQPRRVQWGAPMKVRRPQLKTSTNLRVCVFLAIPTATLGRHWIRHARWYPTLSNNSLSFCGRRHDRSLRQTLRLHHPTTGNSAFTTLPSREQWGGTGTTSELKTWCRTWQRRTHPCLHQQSMCKCRTPVYSFSRQGTRR